jgi:hypothetical protein
MSLLTTFTCPNSIFYLIVVPNIFIVLSNTLNNINSFLTLGLSNAMFYSIFYFLLSCCCLLVVVRLWHCSITPVMSNDWSLWSCDSQVEQSYIVLRMSWSYIFTGKFVLSCFPLEFIIIFLSIFIIIYYI